MNVWSLVALLLFFCRYALSAHNADNLQNRSHLATFPLQGESHLTLTSLPSVYDLKHFICSWDMPSGVYWWRSPLKKGNVVNPIYGGSSGNMTAEVGQGWWLTKPQFSNDTADGSRWTSTAFVATRVAAFNHTSCCCQVMSADLSEKRFWLTEYCRAVVDGLDKSPAETCRPFAEPACPTDNATALRQSWPMPAYSESYSASLDPLGTTLPRPRGLMKEEVRPKQERQHLQDTSDLKLSYLLIPLAGLFLLVGATGTSSLFQKSAPVQPQREESGSDEDNYQRLGGDP